MRLGNYLCSSGKQLEIVNITLVNYLQKILLLLVGIIIIQCHAKNLEFIKIIMFK